MIPIDIIPYKINYHQKYRDLVIEAFNNLPGNVQANLWILSNTKRIPKVIFYSNKITAEEAKLFCRRTPIKVLEKTAWNAIYGCYIAADNVIFISTRSKKLKYSIIINHEFGHLIEHHNLTRFKSKWRELIKNKPRITEYSNKNASEYFADAYTIYIIHKDIFKFFKEIIFK